MRNHRTTEMTQEPRRDWERFFLCFCGVLVFFCVSVLTGCSAQYQGERLYWKAQQFRASLGDDPFQVTAEQFAEAIEKYEQVVRVAPVSEWAGRSRIAAGSLYAVQGKYPAAREAYGQVLLNLPPASELALEARIATAKTYEVQGQWDEAIRLYEEIAEYHPWKRSGLGSLLYIAQIHKRQGRDGKALEAYEQALKRYEKLIFKAPNERVARGVQTYVALAYQQLGRWGEAVAVYEQLARSPEGVNRPLLLLKIGTIYEKALQAPEKAGRAYALVLGGYPEHPFGKVAKRHLERIQAASGEREQNLP